MHRDQRTVAARCSRYVGTIKRHAADPSRVRRLLARTVLALLVTAGLVIQIVDSTIDPAIGAGPVWRLFVPDLVVPSVNRADWTMYRYDLSHGGRNPNETILTRSTVDRLARLWSTSLTPNDPVPQQGIFSTAAVVNGIVYVGSMNGWFHALRLSDGSTVWSRFLSLRSTNPAGENGTIASPTVVGNVIYIASDNASVWALNTADGSVRWNTGLARDGADAAQASPTVMGDRLYVGIANGTSDSPCSIGREVALDTRTGAVIWDTPMTTEPGAGVWASAAADPTLNRIYIATGNPCGDDPAPPPGSHGDSLLALDGATGAIIWEFRHLASDTDDLDFGSSPVIVNGKIAALSKSAAMVAVDAATGQVAWKTQLGSPGAGLNSASVVDGHILVGGSNDDDASGTFYALDAADGRVIWRVVLKNIVLGASAVANGVVYLADDTDLIAIDTDTGRILRRIGTNTLLWGGVTIADGHVLAADQDGVLYSFGIPQASSAVATSRRP